MQISWKRTSRQPIRDGDEGKNCKKMNSLCVFFVITKKRVFPLAKTPLPRRRLLPIFSPKIPFHFASCRSSFWEKLSNQSQPKKEGNVFGYWVNSFFSVAVTTGMLAQFEVGQQSATKITTNLEHEAPAGYKFSVHRSTEFKWNVDLVSETHLGIEENCKRPREKEDGMVTMAMSEAMAQLRLPRTWPTKAMR